MKGKVILEIVISVAFVLAGTFFAYRLLAGSAGFWSAQALWSAALAIGWVIVAAGYYHQGWLVHIRRDAKEVSVILPLAVFTVQCVLFVKGIYYGDWSLIWGALVVNSGVTFSLSQIIKVRRGLFER